MCEAVVWVEVGVGCDEIAELSGEERGVREAAGCWEHEVD